MNFVLIPRLISMAIILAIFFNSSPLIAEENKFQNELRSIVGAAIKTKRGEFSLRQRKDNLGRVRKQILVGKDFSEIQIDQDGDGTIDVWEVTRGPYTVAASQPNRGRFFRLSVIDRIQSGIRESVYLLNRKGNSYDLYSSSLVRKDVRFKVEGGSEESMPSNISSDMMPSTVDLSLRDVNIERCDNENSTLIEVEKLQRAWWQVLNFESRGNRERLVASMKQSKIFDSNCSQPARKKDLDKLANAMATVMLSSPTDQPHSADRTKGRFLTCLEQSGLGVQVARAEALFMESMSGTRSNAMISCEWKPAKAGLAVPADTSPYLRQVAIHLSAVDDGKSKNLDGASNNYQNIFLHELLHLGGIVSEDIANAAQACCGEPSANRAIACKKLDETIFKEKRYIDIEAVLMRAADGVAPFAGKLEELFGAEESNRLRRVYNEGLDNYKRGPPPIGEFSDGLLSDKEFSSCITNAIGTREAREQYCRDRWTLAIKEYTDLFFSKTCRRQVRVNQMKKCREVSDEIKETLSVSIAANLLVRPSTCEGAVSYNSEIESSVFWALLFGPTASAGDEVDCATHVEIPAVSPVDVSAGFDSTGPRSRVVGGAAATDAVIAGQRETDSNIGQGTPGDRAMGSPLPVVRVDSEAAGRTVVENQYRRATDLVGGVADGFKTIRDSILPTARAAEDRSSSLKNKRIAAEENFIAFRPEDIKNPKVKLENPFAVKRIIASESGATTQAPALAAAHPASGSSAALAVEPQFNPSPALDRRKRKFEDQNSNSQVRSTSNVPSVSVRTPSDTEVKSPPVDVLDGIFDLPYSKIEIRLRRLDVIEALIAQKISIQNAAGKKLGSRRATVEYKFVGFDLPLRKQAIDQTGKR